MMNADDRTPAEISSDRRKRVLVWVGWFAFFFIVEFGMFIGYFWYHYGTGDPRCVIGLRGYVTDHRQDDLGREIIRCKYDQRIADWQATHP